MDQYNGIGPWFYIEDVKTDWLRHRGRDPDARRSVAVASSGHLRTGLIRPRNEALSIQKELLEAGHSGLQLMSHWTEDYQGLREKELAPAFRVGHQGWDGSDPV